MWAATGGAVISGESSLAAAARETKEELGLDYSPDRFDAAFRLTSGATIADVWRVDVQDAAEAEVALGPEVAEVRWVTGPELLRMVANGRFHGYGEEYLGRLGITR
jgi:8-oxo-dGTP pyrophosphatase MutT (NUDIX family)